MNELKEKLKVEIVRLEPMRVACVNGFGPNPEKLAWDKLVSWSKSKGLLDDGQKHRIFGYNNPNPSPGSPNYGYDFWVTVGPEIEGDDTARIIDFPGGLFAVTRSNGVENITPNWKRLVAWMEKSRYRQARHQWLEEHISFEPFEPLTPESFTLDLYLPIDE